MKPTRKPDHVAGVEGLKIAISAAALAATVGGWGWLTAHNAPAMAAEPSTSIVEQVRETGQSVPQWLQQPPLIPTIAAVQTLNRPSNASASITITEAAPSVAPAAAPPLREVNLPAVAPAAATAPREVNPPAVAPAAAPPLREVTLPAPAAKPAPAARTRSSR
ncbi:MAG: hypothetical protein K6356_10020 [Chloroflexus sp.]